MDADSYQLYILLVPYTEPIRRKIHRGTGICARELNVLYLVRLQIVTLVRYSNTSTVVIMVVSLRSRYNAVPPSAPQIV